MLVYNINESGGIMITDIQLDAIKKLFYNKMTTRDMAKQLNLSKSTIVKYSKLLKKNPNLKLIHSHNENYFENIDTENKAYWLGFIAADGCIHSNFPSMVINVSQKDLSLIEKFVLDIEYNNKISKMTSIIKETGNYRQMCAVTCTSTKLVSDLSKYGLGPRKTLTLQAPTNIPDNMVRHWIRGYIDGDGCFTWNKKGNRLSLKILGTESVLKYIHKYLNLTCSITNYGKIKCISTGGNQMLTRIGHYLYDDSSLFLKRKRDKFNSLLGATCLGY
jgi:intein-encoded DNA endonuclease-like protein